MPDLGDTLAFSARVYDKDPSADSSAVLVNATSLVLTITLPDGTTVTPTVTNPPAVTGTYTYGYVTTTQFGRYTGRWLFTMASGVTTAYVEVFDVLPIDPGYLISLVAAKKHLNIPLTDTSSDAEIMDWVSGITRVIEDQVGACVPRTVTDEYHDSARVINLRVHPVLSVTSVIPFLTIGTIYSSTQWRVTTGGRLFLLSGLTWYGGPFAVTYRAGRTVIPQNIASAAKLILAHLWETQRGAATPAYLGGSDVSVVPGFGFAIPNRALEMLEPDKLGPGVG